VVVVNIAIIHASGADAAAPRTPDMLATGMDASNRKLASLAVTEYPTPCVAVPVATG